ncbi:MAG TPA: hypothetical protein VEQ61_07105 [Thermoleophilaceae bacterium]|nr:hypothetical protein [Thermoleophilaceae bacterium]
MPRGGALISAVAAAAALLAPASVTAQPPLDSRGIDVESAERCDPLDPAHCLLPWPNDHFTRRDRETDTGRRVHLERESMPRNKEGAPIEPGDYNRSDGFSPGQLIVTKVPGLDTPEAFRRTGAVPITDLARSFDRRQPIVVINARTLRRQLIWAELDSHAQDPRDAALLIRPARNFREGERYIVALRNLKDAEGRTIRARRAFRLYRDRIRTGVPVLERRRRHMERMFRTLRRAGIKRRDLFLAWDFTVASERSLSERVLAIRDDAFAQLGDRDLADLRVEGKSPRFQVERILQRSPCGDGVELGGVPVACDPELDPRVARRVEGHVTVPCYLDQPECPPGSRFKLSEDNIPQQAPGNEHRARFICNVPSGASAGERYRPSLYGHGLLGRAEAVNDRKLYALHDDGLMFCASDWIGMAREDIPNAVKVLGNLSHFPSLADRLQQGFLDFLYLGRALIHREGFSSHPAFQSDGRPVIARRRLFYNGGSQGGILGGALTAIAPDFTRAVLGVPGMNYSTLLRRSIDFDAYALVFNDAYRNELERPLILSMVQMLWDRGEANGYAHHITRDPLPNTPPHEVLLHEAFGDHQVTNWATEVMARTVGARLRVPALDPGRHPAGENAFFGIRPIRRFPYEGSALVVWDIGPLRNCDAAGENCQGTTPPPVENLPNRAGVDPHGPDASETAAGQEQIAEFLRPRGRVIEVCGDGPCYLEGWNGPGG